MVGTFHAHLRNMVHGVTEGYTYQLKTVFSHFPMKVAVKGDKVQIDNYMGGHAPRFANILEGVNLSANYAYTYARTKSEDEWTVLERSIRHAATIAANYHHTWGWYGLNVNLSGRLQSKTYYTGSYEDAPGFGVWNLNTTHSLNVLRWANLESSIGVDNLFNKVDRRIDSSTRKYALYSPGRMLVVGLKLTFKQ